jgi:PAS domain-containing protein
MPQSDKETIERLITELGELHAKVKELEVLAEHHKVRERILRQKEEVLHATLNSATDGILAVDEKGHVIFSNKQFERMWRIPPDLIEAGDDNELLTFVSDQLSNPEEFLGKVRELYRSYRSSNDLIHFRDGRIFERSSLPLVIEDKLSGRVWTFREVTGANRGGASGVS